jgi:hypothetical protein
MNSFAQHDANFSGANAIENWVVPKGFSVMAIDSALKTIIFL